MSLFIKVIAAYFLGGLLWFAVLLLFPEATERSNPRDLGIYLSVLIVALHIDRKDIEKARAALKQEEG